MAKRILADIEAILRRVDEAYPGIPELSRAEVAVLKSLSERRLKLKLSRVQKEPGYLEAFNEQEQWRQHLRTVIVANEQTTAVEPAPRINKRRTGNPTGRPQEYDTAEEARIAQRWGQRDGSMTKKQFAAVYSITVDEFDKLLRRVRARESRERAKH